MPAAASCRVRDSAGHADCTAHDVSSGVIARAGIGIKVRRPKRVGSGILASKQASRRAGLAGRRGGAGRGVATTSLWSAHRRPGEAGGSTIGAACIGLPCCTCGHVACNAIVLISLCLVAHRGVSAGGPATAPSRRECAAAAAHGLSKAGRLSLQPLQVLTLARELQR